MSYNDCRHGAEMCDTCLDNVADGIKQGAEKERERIIELLALEVCDECYNIPIHYNCEFMSLAIALIKGESE